MLAGDYGSEPIISQGHDAHRRMAIAGFSSQRSKISGFKPIDRIVLFGSIVIFL